MLMQKPAQRHHSLRPAADYPTHAALLAPDLVGWNFLVWSFWGIEAPGSAGDNSPGFLAFFDDRPTERRYAPIKAKDFHIFGFQTLEVLEPYGLLTWDAIFCLMGSGNR
jgi:hypothetical protein